MLFDGTMSATYVATPEDIARKLREVRYAAGSAIDYHIDPDLVRQAAEQGIAEVLASQAAVAEAYRQAAEYTDRLTDAA
jgi:hypothetical protein